MWPPRTLLITDTNLGAAAHARVSAICADLTWASWSVNEPAARAGVLDRIAAGTWDLAISCYSDLVLTQQALEAIELPLNIHPALPRLRGMGYDLIPLIENHPTVGATLHRMERRVDSGEIFLVHEDRVPAERTYASLRKFNQSLTLGMLDTLCALMVGAGSVRHLSAGLRDRGARQAHRWSAAYYSRQSVEALRDLYGEAGERLAGGLGFEPRLAESESAVLPLDDPPTKAGAT